MDPEISKQVEAVLFASGRYMDAKRIAELISTTEKNVRLAAQALREHYMQSGSALQVVEEDNAWKLHVQDTYLDLVSRVISDTEVSGPVLETLAIIAWRTPILQSEVVDIRGSNAYEHIKELVERGFITKEQNGRSYDLRITEKFFDYFDIEGREDIRKVFKEVEEEHRKKEMDLELEQKRLEAAIKKAEEGEVAEVDMPQEVQQTLPQKKVNIDDLDKILEKSAKTRESVGADLASLRKTDDSEQGTENSESEEDPDAVLQEAQEVREKVEKDVEEL